MKNRKRRVTKEEVIYDGWSRNFQLDQIKEKLFKHDYLPSDREITLVLEGFEKEYLNELP